MTTLRSPIPRRAWAWLALTLLALSGCGRHHRQELQRPGAEPPLTTSSDDARPARIMGDSPAVQRWAGGD